MTDETNEIQIDENYTVSANSNCWTLKYKKESERDGKKVTSTDETFHNSLPQALRKYLDSAIKPAQNISELLDRINAVGERIDALKSTKP